ncbi:aspartate/tyrosine/aromatic aminotransferase [Paralcaligenes sp. KSB-10]|jgi:aromatic-amino-acid transaminase|uniref:amino acid aminotransferase n=1 Tax=Paralcaligenes sp. KSB-10 TaxID=2901142 RepID=UPI001E65A63B|nr:amino acid aminotransferase [Paralcaligenes sp. KSB-10]UHL63718.1 aspartate/tyrosine/aromatic aminotransferase [Paralcaligenes sp. KSB-10]
MFEHLERYAGDPIFRLGEEFHQDPRSQKVNLTVGLYYDNEGAIPLLKTVQTAEARRIANPQPRPYLPIEGLASYRSAVQKLVFGAGHEALHSGRVATIQSVGGTGALKVGADFLHAAYPDSQIWISDPAWDNHHAIFQGAGIKTHTYTYYDPQTKALLFERMLGDLSALPRHSIVLLHPCCHNPTGVDLSQEQWLRLIPVLEAHELIPFLDIAYQGFGTGLQEDAFAIRAMADAGLSFLVANSFSKNFSFYAERCGGLSVVCASRDEAERVLGQLKAIVRRIYSNPPMHGGQVTSTVLNDPELYGLWEREVAEMRARIAFVRQQAHEQLKVKLPGYDSSYFVTQQGMFSYTGLSIAQLRALRDTHGVYIIDSGRISVPGLNTHNIDYFTDAMASVLQEST